MQTKTLSLDPRYFQVIFQLIFLLYGISWLGWEPDWRHYSISIGGCIAFTFIGESIRQRKLLAIIGKDGFGRWGFSVLISAMSICLLLKVNHWETSLLAAFFTVASKYVFRIKRKHIFNPSAFGIIACILLTEDAWLSPGQWGSNAIIFFAVITLGTIVVTRVQKLDVSLAFLVTFIALLYWRQVYVLGWPIDHFIHSISTGSLLLFTFFMISDPRTSPNHPVARIIWAVLIAATAFYLAAFKWKYNTPLWVLVGYAPLVPILDWIFPANNFTWRPTNLKFSFISIIKRIVMKPFMKKIAALFILCAMIGQQAFAFCGFYVSKADGALKNKTSQVILVRDGNRNVITMFNDFKGNPKDFAMVVPVPVVLKKTDIKVVDQSIFRTLNEYSQARLVEYYDDNPCESRSYEKLDGRVPGVSTRNFSAMDDKEMAKTKSSVRIEAKYIVGEYDILILSAKQSSDLKTWLDENNYKIPAGAEEVLEPYIKSNLKFFVVKVNEEERKKLPGDFLRPIQISFESPKFMLPIRLGMANADGDQDMIVYAFTKKGRVECTNYRTISLPTGKNVPLFVKSNFNNFYTNLFQHQWSREGKSAVMLEYAWDVSPKNYVKCDPCVSTAPSAADLVQAGVWWISRDWSDYSDVDDEEEAYSDNVYFTRLHVRYNRQSFPQDLVFQVTPNKDNYQARYIITHPATGDLSCDAGKKYLRDLKERRKGEMEMLAYLTGKDVKDWDLVNNDPGEQPAIESASYKQAAIELNKTARQKPPFVIAGLGLLGVMALAGLALNRKNKGIGH